MIVDRCSRASCSATGYLWKAVAVEVVVAVAVCVCSRVLEAWCVLHVLVSLDNIGAIGFWAGLSVLHECSVLCC